jgi:site-specific recombinase XerD
MPDTDLPRPDNACWASILDGWDRGLRAANRSWNTRYNYELAGTQLGGYLADLATRPAEATALGLDPTVVTDAAADPAAVSKAHIEAFIAWMSDTRSVSTAANKYRALQQLYRYLWDEEIIERSPFDKLKQPRPPKRLIPVVSMEHVAELLAQVKPVRTDTAPIKYVKARDAAMIRLLVDCGARRDEIVSRGLPDVDLAQDVLRVIGKGDRQRAIPFGPKTGQALARYLRERAKKAGADLPALWLDSHGRKPLGPDGLKMMLRRRGKLVGLPTLHPHQFRHTLAHEWLSAGGGETELMRIMGWTSRDMLLVYGASAADERAHAAHRRMALGDRV